MQHPLSHRQLTCFALLAALGCGAVAPAADLANTMPSDTLLYVGWSQWLEKDAPDVRFARHIIEVVDKLTAEAEKEEAAIAGLVLEALAPLQTGSVGLGLFDVTMASAAPGIELDIELALVVSAGRDNAKLVDAVGKFLDLVGGSEDVEQHEINGVRLSGFRVPNAPLHLVWGLHEDHFLLTLGETAAGKVIDCLNGTSPTLADCAELKFDRAKVKANLDGRHFCLYADVQRTFTCGKRIATGFIGELPPIVDQAIAELGLDTYRSKYLHADKLDGKPRMMGFAHVEGSLRGLLALWKQEPLTDEDLKIVPHDAYWMQVNNLDLAALWGESMRIVGELAPDAAPMIEGAVAMSAGFLGFSITNDLLPALGDTWAFFDAPDHGGFLLTGTILVAEVNSAEALHGMLSRAVEMLAPLLKEQGVSLRQCQIQRDGHTIHYVMIAGVPSPVVPAWSFVGDRVVFGLYPQTVATALKQVDPRTRGKSILEHPAFQSARAELPKEALGVGYYDSKYFARLFYPLLNGLQAAGVSMLAEYGVELDLDLMPPLPEQVEKVTNFVGTSGVDQDGILYASIGDGAPLVAIAGGAALGTSILLPSLSRARELAKRAVSTENLLGIGQACHIYANDHSEKFPESLEQLIEAGLTTRKILSSPRDPGGGVSYTYISGQTTSSAPRNVLAYERVRDDEGTNVLFLDGHVEFMKLAGFKEALRKTYRRLCREDEIPAKFRE